MDDFSGHYDISRWNAKLITFPSAHRDIEGVNMENEMKFRPNPKLGLTEPDSKGSWM